MDALKPRERLLGPALRTQPDRRLVALARDGSEPAQEEIVRRYRAALVRYADFHDSHELKFRWMLRVQKLIPRVPPRLLGPAIRLMGSRRFVEWSFDHYLAIAPPEFAGSAPDAEAALPEPALI